MDEVVGSEQSNLGHRQILSFIVKDCQLHNVPYVTQMCFPMYLSPLGCSSASGDKLLYIDMSSIQR
jgi:hypothetical protein